MNTTNAIESIQAGMSLDVWIVADMRPRFEHATVVEVEPASTKATAGFWAVCKDGRRRWYALSGEGTTWRRLGECVHACGAPADTLCTHGAACRNCVVDSCSDDYATIIAALRDGRPGSFIATIRKLRADGYTPDQVAEAMRQLDRDGADANSRLGDDVGEGRPIQ
jgi:hypothetical protein